MKDKTFEIILPEDGSGVRLLFVASGRAGKSFFLTHLLKTLYKEVPTFLFSNSLHHPIYADVKDRSKTASCSDYRTDFVKDFYKIQKATDNHYGCVVVQDDIVDNRNDKELKKLLCVYRNSKMHSIVSIQSPYLIPPALRGNFDYVFIGAQNSEELWYDVCKMYLSSTLKGKMTEKIAELKTLVADHHWIIIDNLTGEIYRTKIVI